MIKQKIKGRGAQLNPKNRFEKLHTEELNEFEPVFQDEDPYVEPTSEQNVRKMQTVFYKDDSKSIIAKNDSYDLGFDYSFNPYRGCEHGCIYCYARPSHEYLGFSSGTDFETKIMVKENAPKLLEDEFKKRNYEPKFILFSGNTDCYQPIEKKLQLTREALKICLRYRNPIGIITKNALVQRDIDILKQMAELNLVTVTLSITTLDNNLVRKMEPRTSSPEMKLKTIELMAANGIPTGVNIAPVIPGLNDLEIPNILKEASQIGADYAGHAMLRLPYAVKDLFIDWITKEFPERSNKILNSIREIRGGKLNSSEWGIRFRGEGELADTIHNLFNISCRKYGLNKRTFHLPTEHFIKAFPQQLELFP